VPRQTQQENTALHEAAEQVAPLAPVRAGIVSPPPPPLPQANRARAGLEAKVAELNTMVGQLKGGSPPALPRAAPRSAEKAAVAVALRGDAGRVEQQQSQRGNAEAESKRAQMLQEKVTKVTG
jgi:hypothetical protein